MKKKSFKNLKPLKKPVTAFSSTQSLQQENVITQDLNKNSTKPFEVSNNCIKAILHSLSYKALFKSGVSYFQLYNFLICSTKFSKLVFDNALKDLIAQKQIVCDEGIYYLSSIKPYSYEKRCEVSIKFLNKSIDLAYLLAKIPWLQFVAVTGSVAAFNSTANDDIDLFLITKSNRLWLTRFFVVMFLKIFSVYRTTNNSAQNFCPNLYLTSSNLVWNKDAQNIYVANEILMMMPILNREDTYFKFLNANKWVTNFFAGFEINFELNKKAKTKLDNSFGYKILNVVDNWFMKLQLKYMKNKITNEIACKDFIHFKKMDHSEKILKDYAEIMK